MKNYPVGKELEKGGGGAWQVPHKYINSICKQN